VVYLGLLIKLQHEKVDSAAQVFGEMAQIYWSEKDIPFAEKVRLRRNWTVSASFARPQSLPLTRANDSLFDRIMSAV
jgi:hypothetical protein